MHKKLLGNGFLSKEHQTFEIESQLFVCLCQVEKLVGKGVLISIKYSSKYHGSHMVINK